jgi:hypothetical protein
VAERARAVSFPIAAIGRRSPEVLAKAKNCYQGIGMAAQAGRLARKALRDDAFGAGGRNWPGGYRQDDNTTCGVIVELSVMLSGVMKLLSITLDQGVIAVVITLWARGWGMWLRGKRARESDRDGQAGSLSYGQSS